MNYEIEELFCKYNLANVRLAELFDGVDATFSRNGYNPIEHHKGRVKKVNSIKKKLKQRNLQYNAFNIENNLSDVVGYRIVCTFLSDIEILKNIIYRMEENGFFKVVEEVDYIKHPKEESGYSSYHIIVLIPVIYNGSIEYVKAEIQLRTVAMDMSFSLEHKTIYKKEKCPEALRDKIDKTVKFCKIIDNDLDNIVMSLKNQNASKKIVDGNSNNIDYLNSGTVSQLSSVNPLELDLMKLKYDMVLKYVKNIFEELKERYVNSENVNPIEHIKCRLKSDAAIERKLVTKRIDVSLENIEKYVNDVVGIRVVCSFLSDINLLVDEIYNMQDKGLLEILDIRDYTFEHRKKNGYSGYHFLVMIPMYGGVTVEIQLRTVAMEMWASLEEKIFGSPSSRIINGFVAESMQEYFEIQENLKRMADVLGIFDTELDYIVNKYNCNLPEGGKKLIRIKKEK